MIAGDGEGERVPSSRRLEDGIARRALTFPAGFNQFARDIAGDFEGLGDGAALGDQAGELLGCCKVEAFGQLFDMNLDGQFHTP